MTLFFTSDTHFGHENIISLCNRPFRDVDHMNSEIIRRWNEVVTPDDVVVHLGDVALGKIDNSLRLVSQLNGYKILVNGNHDRPFMNKGKKRFEEWHARYSEVFEEVTTSTAQIEILRNGLVVLVSHFPYNGDSGGEDRYSEARPFDWGRTLLHGHTHKTNRLSRSERGTLQVHVGQDAWDYRPVSENEIIDLLP